MDAQALLSSFSADQLQLLRTALDQMTDVSGRSPFRPRQLHDLREAASADNPRPTFFWSAKSPSTVDVSRTSPYPRLMWHAQTGKEITIGIAADPIEKNLSVQAAYTAQGFILTPPANAEKPSPFEALKDMLEGLSKDDQHLVLKGAHATRLDRMKDGILGLSDEEREALVAALMPAQDKRKSA